MSRGRPRRAAALHAEWLSREQRQLAHSASADHPHLTALLDDDDSRDASYGPSASKRRRPTIAALSDGSDCPPLPPPVALTPDSAFSPSPTEFDIWDEDPRDIRHQRTRMIGCYVIAPLYRVPAGYIDERTAKEREEQQQPQSNSIPSPPPLILLPSGVTSQSPSEPLRSVQARDAALTAAISALSAGFSSTVSSLHRSTFAAIHRWLCGTAHVTDRWSLSCLVPTALVHCGVDVEDHPLLFSQLSTFLTSPSAEEGCHCLPLLLSSASATSVEKTIQQLLLSLLTLYPPSTSSTSLTLRSSASSHYLHSHQQHATRTQYHTKHLWSNLAHWWHHTQADHSSSPQHHTPLRLLLIIPDVAMWDAAVLTGALYALMTHEGLRGLPWVWVMGLSVDGRAMRGVGERVMSRVKVTSFHLSSSSSLLTPTFQSLLLHPSSSLPLPILSPPTLSYLLRSYATHHRSIAAWSTILRTIACEYYGRVEYSHLTQAWREGKGTEVVQGLTGDEVAELRRVVGEDGKGGAVVAEGRGRRRLTFSDAEYRQKLVEWMEEFEEGTKGFVLGSSLLHCLVDALLSTKVSADVILLDVYLHLWPSAGAHPTLETFPLLVSVLQAVRTQPSAVVQSALQSMRSSLQEKELQTEAGQVRKVMDELKEGETAALQRSTTVRATTQPVRASNASARRAAQLGESLQADHAREAVRAKVVSFLSSFFSTRLVPPTSLPLSSLFIFDCPALHSMFSFDQQGAVTEACTVGCRASSSSSSPRSSSPSSSSAQPPPPLSASMDDMAIVFRLYQEADLHLALYGWFTAFCSVVATRAEEEEEEEERKEGREKAKRKRSGKRSSAVEDEGDFLASLGDEQQRQLYVRFSACVNALRWCGFIKPAGGKRGREEMIKLIFEH